MVRKSVPDDRSGSDETSFIEFRCCSRHGQISTFRRTETGSAREIRRRYADVLETCRTGTSDTVECKKCRFKLDLSTPLRRPCVTSYRTEERNCCVTSRSERRYLP